ncbi:hypothetical protein ZWY2020_026830 [Hordeum vulgare]|nr:hypothetical protein ZWY2020_026830 [Hordeum vulgare]
MNARISSLQPEPRTTTTTTGLRDAARIYTKQFLVASAAAACLCTSPSRISIWPSSLPPSLRGIPPNASAAHGLTLLKVGGGNNGGI